jgi:hypothetical protein
MGVLMLTNNDSDRSLEDLTDAEIYSVIRYLEPDPRNANEQGTGRDSKDNSVVICVCLYIALFICLAFFWFYWR